MLPPGGRVMIAPSADRTLDRAPPVDGRGVEALLDRFFRFELGERLFDRRFCGIALWQQIRLPIFVKLCTTQGFFHNSPVLPKPSLSQRDRRRLLTRFNPLLAPRRASIVVIESPTLYRRGSGTIDIYTEPVIAQLGHVDIERVDMSGGPLEAIPGVRHASALAIDTIRVRASRFYARLFRRRFTAGEEAEALRRLDARLAEEFAVPRAASSIALGTLVHFLAGRIAWRCYFALRRPRLVILGVQAYGFEGLISAAQRYGARVVELQHGAIYPGHLGYHLPAPGPLNPHVDALLTFGRIWHGAVQFATELHRATIGFPYLQEALAAHAPVIAAKRPQIAVLSCDPFQGEPLLDAVGSLGTASPLPIVIRPHPSDPFDYGAGVPPRLHGRVRVASPSEPVHRLLAESEYAVCGPSTTLFEALAFSCRTVGLPLAFRSVFEPLLAGTGARIAAAPSDAGEALRAAGPPGDMSAWFEPRPPALRDLLDQLFPGLLAG